MCNMLLASAELPAAHPCRDVSSPWDSNTCTEDDLIQPMQLATTGAGHRQCTTPCKQSIRYASCCTFRKVLI